MEVDRENAFISENLATNLFAEDSNESETNKENKPSNQRLDFPSLPHSTICFNFIYLHNIEFI